jgi:RNA polymerase sigma-70 factor (ECF subfamily)
MAVTFDTCLKHRPELLSLAKRYAGSADAAEDLTQDTLVRAFRHWDNFKQETDDVDRDVKVWLKRILTNVFYTSYQRDQRRAQAHEEYTQELDETCTEHPSEEAERVKRVMGKLRPMYKEVLEKHYIEGHSYQQIADELGIKFVQVQKRLYRARQYIKTFYEQAGLNVSRNPKASVGGVSRPTKDPAPLEPTESPQTDTDGVDRVVTRDNGKPLRRRKAVPNSLTTR